MQNDVRKSVSILRFFYGVVPIVAGIDKFFNILVDWEMYLNSLVGNMIDPTTFLAIVGIVEIVAGILVFVKTRLGAYIVSAWLTLIGLNLVIVGFYDIAVRDFVMAAGAYVLGKLSVHENARSATSAES